MLWWTLWKLRSKKRPAKVSVIARLGETRDSRVISALVELLRGKGSAAEAAWTALVKIGTPAVGPLNTALGDPVTVGSASDALGKIRDVRSILPLVQAVRRDADGLGQFAKTWLIELAETRELGTATVETLVSLLKDQDYNDYVRSRVVEALGRIGGTEPVEPLRALLRKPEYAKAASRGLRALRWKAEDNEEAVLMASAEEDAQRLARLGSRGQEVLIGMLAGSSEPLRAKAANALAESGWEPADDRERAQLALAKADRGELLRLGNAAVEALLDDLKQVPKAEVIDVLGEIGDARAVEPLLAILENQEHWHIGSRVLLALGRIGDARALPVLEDNLQRYAQNTRGESAAEALTTMIHVAPDQARNLLSHENQKVRVAAVNGLAHARDPWATDLLVDTLRRQADSDVAYMVAKSLRTKGWKPPNEEAAAWLAVAESDCQAALSIGPAAAEALTHAMRGFWRIGPRTRAAAAMAERKEPWLIGALVAALDDPVYVVRLRAAEGLRRLDWQPLEERDRARLQVQRNPAECTQCATVLGRGPAVGSGWQSAFDMVAAPYRCRACGNIVCYSCAKYSPCELCQGKVFDRV